MNNQSHHLAQKLCDMQHHRLLVAIAGAPASGKSTLAETLALDINRHNGSETAIVLPMDGFHLDNIILEEQQLRHRKGAPHTFDAAGFIELVRRIANSNSNVFIPLFDRKLDLARAGARCIQPCHSIILIEGNYLLLDQAPWPELYALFDYKIFIDVAEDVLIKRLTQRWLDHDHSQQDALARAHANDIPNGRLVVSNRLRADAVVSGI